ncbi:LCP family protein [Tessaracoccus defluvii]|uniref:LCP family protein n=1 Tax=Tessaracoccus defluvii TaxID=1285901 RepID=A0A7H0H9R1_9ACTN|nr:LCP family protein [Tessaracoccus defluvii]QNP57277.1 LCP family protein [Tessaracoccus defluvii]
MTHPDDMDWLYRRGQEPEPEPEHTAILRPADAAALDRPYRGRKTGPAGGPPHQPPAPQQPVSFQPPPAPPPPAKRTRRRRRPVMRVIGTLFLVWVLFLVGAPAFAWFSGTRVDAASAGERPADQPGTTVLLVGSDSREDLTDEERALLGTGSTEGRRTDTMMLLHMPTVGDPVLLSLPRDSLVEIPGRKRNKLNAAFAFGGAPLLVETIEHNTGVRLDGYLEVGFAGVVDVVDAVGGIEVCPKFDFDDKDAHLSMKAGCQQVDGVTALGYVRMRKSDKTGDIGRMGRQREVIGAIGREVVSPMTLLNPVRYWNVNQAAARSLARGEDTGIVEVAQVGVGFLSVMTGRGISLMVPVSDADARTDVGSVMIWDEQAAGGVFAALAAGDTTSLEKYRK